MHDSLAVSILRGQLAAVVGGRDVYDDVVKSETEQSTSVGELEADVLAARGELAVNLLRAAN